MRAWPYVVTLLVAASTGASAQAPEQAFRGSSLTEIFEEANIAASRGDYPSAISGYRTLIEVGVRDPDVYFNLATSFAQLGDYPRAILNYERALSLRPNDTQAVENLSRAEKTLEERRAEAEGEATIHRSSSISDAVYRNFTENALAYALLVANLAFFVCLAWAWISHRRTGLLYASLVASGCVLLFSAVGLGVKAGMLRDGARAVALEDRVILLEGPDSGARARGQARGGDRGQVVDEDRDFVKLRVVTGLEGWVPASAVGLVDLSDGVH